ncbi:hypothetical protein K443DRAFT_602697 [Laccaria amethystina LaAM-08-1]|uniref:Uncharacterized protein n=1 Tax=Laccaria amethystina LaAM-08-1 TaxID=1095629 RepID=A0A0C9X649_9AGAR|nr:hypothetical protein K443DRAFT_602697 [Laccaria amethystina LaAM-08-1]
MVIWITHFTSVSTSIGHSSGLLFTERLYAPTCKRELWYNEAQHFPKQFLHPRPKSNKPMEEFFRTHTGVCKTSYLTFRSHLFLLSFSSTVQRPSEDMTSHPSGVYSCGAHTLIIWCRTWRRGGMGMRGHGGH